MRVVDVAPCAKALLVRVDTLAVLAPGEFVTDTAKTWAVADVDYTRRVVLLAPCAVFPLIGTRITLFDPVMGGIVPQPRDKPQPTTWHGEQVVWTKLQGGVCVHHILAQALANTAVAPIVRDYRRPPLQAQSHSSVT